MSADPGRDVMPGTTGRASRERGAVSCCGVAKTPPMRSERANQSRPADRRGDAPPASPSRYLQPDRGRAI